MTDKRTREHRENEILDAVIRTGGIATAWLKENRNRPEALERVKAAGLIREVPGGWDQFTYFEIVPAEPVPWWVRLWRKACGEESC